VPEIAARARPGRDAVAAKVLLLASKLLRKWRRLLMMEFLFEQMQGEKMKEIPLFLRKFLTDRTVFFTSPPILGIELIQILTT
jgi:hypothetical protein